MKPQFIISNPPPSAADIDSARRHYGRLSLTTQWLNIPLMVGAIAVGWGVWRFLLSAMPLPNTDPGNVWVTLMWSVISGCIGFTTSTFLFSMLNVWRNYLREADRKLAIIELSDSEAALCLAAKYPEIETYRKAAVLSRKITSGDLDAMKAFAMEHEKALAARTLEEKQKAAFSRLHKST